MGMPASRITDMHVWPMVTGVVAPGGMLASGPRVPVGSLSTDLRDGPPAPIARGAVAVHTRTPPAGRIDTGLPAISIGG